MKKIILNATIIIILTSLFSSCSSTAPAISTPPAHLPYPSNPVYQTPLFNGGSIAIWNNLLHTPSNKLMAMQKETLDPSQQAWVQLALISKRNSTNTQKLAQELNAWREHNPSHPANQFIPNPKTLVQLIGSQPPKHIAILLPQQGVYGTSGQIVREGFLNAYYANQSKAPEQSIKFYDTSKTHDMTALYQQAIAEGADFVVGPLLKDHVQQLQSQPVFTAPTLALNYANSQSGAFPANLYQFGLLPDDEVNQIVNRAHAAQRHKAIVIAPQNAWGKRLVATLTQRFQAVGGTIQDTWYYSAKSHFTEEVAQLLKSTSDKNAKDAAFNVEAQKREDFNVIFLFAQPEAARLIVPLLRFNHADNIPIYATSAVIEQKSNAVKSSDLNGVIVCDLPWNLRFKNVHIQDENQRDRLYAVGQDAYLLTQTLNRLVLLPHFPIYGSTGALTLSNMHQIHRSLPCEPIRNDS